MGGLGGLNELNMRPVHIEGDSNLALGSNAARDENIVSKRQAVLDIVGLRIMRIDKCIKFYISTLMNLE